MAGRGGAGEVSLGAVGGKYLGGGPGGRTA